VNSGFTLYGLRHTVAVILRECGYDERTIADALGQKTIEMARRYARGAEPYKEDDRRRQEVRSRGEQAPNKSVKPIRGSVKPWDFGWQSSKGESIQRVIGGRTRTRTFDPLIKSLQRIIDCVEINFQLGQRRSCDINRPAVLPTLPA
jgi:hypothetical protein